MQFALASFSFVGAFLSRADFGCRGIASDELLGAVVATFVGVRHSMLVQSNAAGGTEVMDRMQGAMSWSGNPPHGVIAWQGCFPSLHAPRAETRLTVYRAHPSVVSGSEK